MIQVPFHTLSPIELVLTPFCHSFDQGFKSQTSRETWLPSSWVHLAECIKLNTGAQKALVIIKNDYKYLRNLKVMSMDFFSF